MLHNRIFTPFNIFDDIKYIKNIEVKIQRIQLLLQFLNSPAVTCSQCYAWFLNFVYSLFLQMMCISIMKNDIVYKFIFQIFMLPGISGEPSEWLLLELSRRIRLINICVVHCLFSSRLFSYHRYLNPKYFV